MELLQSQKNQLFTIIEESGLNPSQFTIGNITSSFILKDQVTHIGYKGSNYYFIFDNGKHNPFISIFSPGYLVLKDSIANDTWVQILDNFRSWLSNLKRELECGDYWSKLEKEMNDLGTPLPYNDSKYSDDELKELEEKIGIFRVEIEKSGLSKDELTIINQKLDFLIEKAKTLSKFDWKSLFLGTFINLIIALNVSPGTAQQIKIAIKIVFETFFLK